MITDLLYNFFYELEVSVNITEYEFFSVNAFITAFALSLGVVVSYFFVGAPIENSAVILRNYFFPKGREVIDYDYIASSRRHVRYYALWPLGLGILLNIVFLISREDVSWYLSDGFSLLPQGGTWSVYVSAVLINIFLFGMGALLVSMIRAHGLLFGILAAIPMTLIGIASLVSGFFGGTLLLGATLIMYRFKKPWAATACLAGPIFGTMSLPQLIWTPIDRQPDLRWWNDDDYPYPI